MELTEYDRRLLSGAEGEPARLALEALELVGRSEGAPHLVDIAQAHVDGCLYHGPAGLEFVEMLVRGGGEVSVPTTLNVSSLDLIHPELYRGDEGVAESALRLMEGYVALGCQPTWTCAPYQLVTKPSYGQQIAWGESNAIVFANSVIGARTARYGDFLDVYCAIAGRAPYMGLHTDQGRRATRLVRIEVSPTTLDSDAAYPLIGHVVGQEVDQDVPLIVGLDDRASEDRLKALGAAAASAGAVGMFHALGVTPEAGSYRQAVGGDHDLDETRIDDEALLGAAAALDSSTGSLGAVSVGTPHFSLDEVRHLSHLAGGRVSQVPFYVNTSRQVLSDAQAEGLASVVDRFGAQFVTDTCTYVTPVMADVQGDVMTNSAKWAYYAPGRLGHTVAFGTLAECVESAVAGHTVRLGVSAR